jgi:hypothetical protein
MYRRALYCLLKIGLIISTIPAKVIMVLKTIMAMVYNLSVSIGLLNGVTILVGLGYT